MFYFLLIIFINSQNPTEEEFADVVKAGERNTWPFIPRIKAHCLVEMSLDTCVQKLRRQIARDSANNKAKLLQAQGGADKMNRLPSFYTTRSIINLSGLSVSDPLPSIRPITTSHGERHSSNPAFGSRGALQPSPLAANSASAINAFNSSNNDYGLESDFNGKKVASNGNLSKKSSSSSLPQGEASPTRSAAGGSVSSLQNNVSSARLKDMTSEEVDELFASVPAPDMYLPVVDDSTKSGILKSSRFAWPGEANLGYDVSGGSTEKNGGYIIGSPRLEMQKQGIDPAGVDSNSSLYASVPGADTLLADPSPNPRSSIVSSRYSRAPKAQSNAGYSEEQRQQQYLDLTLTAANLGDLNATKQSDSPEKKSEITK